MPYPPSQTAPRPAHLRGHRPLFVSLFLGIAGIVLIVVGGIVGFSQSLGKVNGFQRVSVAAGAGSVTFGETGGYLAYYEAPNFDTNGGHVPIVQVRLTSPSGQQMILHTLYGNHSGNTVTSLTYDQNGHHGAALWQFHISETGRYRVELAAPPNASPQADMAFGRSIASGLAIGGVLAIVGVLLIIAAIILLIIGLVKRSHHKRELRTAGYVGGPPPPPGAWPAQPYQPQPYQPQGYQPGGYQPEGYQPQPYQPTQAQQPWPGAQ